MSQQALDLRRSMQIVRRHKILVGIVVALGILAGAAYAVLKPPMLTSTALVALPVSQSVQPATSTGGTDPFTATQEVVAGSYPGAPGALPDVIRPCRSMNSGTMSRLGSPPRTSFRLPRRARTPPKQKQPRTPWPTATSLCQLPAQRGRACPGATARVGELRDGPVADRADDHLRAAGRAGRRADRSHRGPGDRPQ